MDKYIFIIDTDSYAGNFERYMCAYLTGKIGECGVGREMAKIFENDKIKINFNNIEDTADENGCYRPVEIQPNPNWFNNGMGGHYRISDENIEKQLKDSVKAQEDYWLPLIKQKEEIIKKLKKGKKVSNWTIEAAESEITRHKQDIEKEKKRKTVQKYPAYMSVGIYFSSRPTKEQIDFMKNRVESFESVMRKSADYNKNFKLKIEGFRLIKVTKAEKEENIDLN